VDQSTDAQAAKETLLLALQEISERPVDDMDWSPNSVHLQEIRGDGTGIIMGRNSITEKQWIWINGSCPLATCDQAG